jgi:hypothetical protein
MNKTKPMTTQPADQAFDQVRRRWEAEGVREGVSS